ncbi:MAG TPA: tetratricopeptide repeat protein [Bacteroidia bacterium]|jgi:tetratricopeptide (TPR) repeat protein|nr:tetratricopeptide repeat protein [Bacteroidia bacterium]
MLKKRCWSFIIALTLCSVLGFSQTAKKYFAAAEKFEQANNPKDALDSYSKAIGADPAYEKAYTARALLYEKQNMKAEAVEDYKKLIGFSPKEKELYYNAGRLSFIQNKFKDADEFFRKALERDKSYEEVIDLEIKTLYAIQDYSFGLTVTQYALDVKKTAVNYYNHAVMFDSLKNYVEAEKEYKNSKYFDSKFIPGYVGLALTQVKLNKANDALTTCETALTKDPNSNDVYWARSMVYVAKKDYQNALNDITKVILVAPTSFNHKLRGSIYYKLGQFQNAVNDYSQAIKLNDKDIDAYISRAVASEGAQNYKSAIADYNKVAKLAAGDAKIEGIIKDARKKIFDLSRESNKPEIALTAPSVPNKNTIKILADKDTVIFKGVITDASHIKSITVNTIPAEFLKDSLNPEFICKVTGMKKASEVVVLATDDYENTASQVLKIEKTEANKPVIAIEAPAASFDNEIYLENNASEIYIQGRIKDESLIQSISIDGVLASYSVTSLNPTFSSQISIANKQKITVTVVDANGNENIQVFTLNRSGADASANPMGNTWVVFIENGKYQNFASLEGPAKDVLAMKSALAGYKVTKILHKKDMTKYDMEKFFSIELRDHVKNSNIQSLVIWYAGHGKFVSPTGYWVPVDAKTDDEFSFFGINNLKAAMQSYTGKLLHILVVTDACESGPSFLLAMRGADENQRCENWELTKSKSSQVITSAGYELASDNSQFTKTFSAALVNNPDGCISIDKIAKKVISAVTSAGNQAPKFGKIKDLEDEGGTFFFIKK